MSIETSIANVFRGSRSELGAVLNPDQLKSLVKNGGKNGKDLMRTVVLESSGFLVAEALCGIVSLAAIAAIPELTPLRGEVGPDKDKKEKNGHGLPGHNGGGLAILAFPVDTASRALGKVIEPALKPLEKALTFSCRLEECQPDLNKSTEERSAQMAHGALALSGSWTAGLLTKGWVRAALNKRFGICDSHAGMFNPRAKRIFIADEATHLVAFVLGNTVFAKQTDQLIHTGSDILQSFGVPKKTADNVSLYFGAYELSNAVGATAGIATIYLTHKYPSVSMTKALSEGVRQL